MLNSNEKKAIGLVVLITIAVACVTMVACLATSWLVLNALVVFGVMASYTSAQLYWGAVIWLIVSGLFKRVSN